MSSVRDACQLPKDHSFLYFGFHCGSGEGQEWKKSRGLLSRTFNRLPAGQQLVLGKTRTNLDSSSLSIMKTGGWEGSAGFNIHCSQEGMSFGGGIFSESLTVYHRGSHQGNVGPFPNVTPVWHQTGLNTRLFPEGLVIKVNTAICCSWCGTLMESGFKLPRAQGSSRVRQISWVLVQGSQLVSTCYPA